MTDMLFYHLQRQPLESVLPPLVEKSLARGWHVVIEVPEPARLAALDDHLWTFRQDSFIPHATESDPDAAHEPVLLVGSGANPNGAAIRFLVDGAGIGDDAATYERIVLIFDGNDTVALQQAREEWRKARALGLEVTYWQQDDTGRWSKVA